MRDAASAELLSRIAVLKSVLADPDELLVRDFNEKTRERAALESELKGLSAPPVDGGLVYNNVRDRLLETLQSQAQLLGFSTGRSDGSVSLSDLARWLHNNKGSGVSKGVRPVAFWTPDGKRASVSKWIDLTICTVEWLVDEGFLTDKSCPVSLGKLVLVDTSRESLSPSHKFRKLRNRFYVDANFSSVDQTRYCSKLLAWAGYDPAGSRVLLNKDEALLPGSFVSSSSSNGQREPKLL